MQGMIRNPIVVNYKFLAGQLGSFHKLIWPHINWNNMWCHISVLQWHWVYGHCSIAHTLIPKLTKSKDQGKGFHDIRSSCSKRLPLHHLSVFSTSEPKDPPWHGYFNWMIPNHYLKNWCFTNQPYKKKLVFKFPGGFRDIVSYFSQLALL